MTRLTLLNDQVDLVKLPEFDLTWLNDQVDLVK